MKWKLDRKHLVISGSYAEIDHFLSNYPIPDGEDADIIALHLELDTQPPPSIKRFGNLRWLRIISSRWTSISPEIFPRKLETLIIESSSFESITDFFANILQLRDLKSISFFVNTIKYTDHRFDTTAFPLLNNIDIHIAHTIPPDLLMLIPSEWTHTYKQTTFGNHYKWQKNTAQKLPTYTTAPIYNPTIL
jgi:hypothetical protein